MQAIPALVILDLMLPDMDGLEVCRRIRALPGALGRVPLLMLTARATDGSHHRSIGADDYLPKPWAPQVAGPSALCCHAWRGQRSRLHPWADRWPVRVASPLRFGALDVTRMPASRTSVDRPATSPPTSSTCW